MLKTLALAATLLMFAAPTFAATWTVDPAQSKLGFSGTQTEQPFSGTFKTWTGSIDFDPTKPDAAHVLVTIDTGSATTADTQRDEALPQEDWFDVAKFPKATFEATGFTPRGPNAYEAKGKLTIRGIAKDVTLPFTLTTTGDMAHAVGKANLIRTDFGVGQGDWASPQWVAFEVNVDIDLKAKRAP